jgi:hypothetical protein
VGGYLPQSLKVEPVISLVGYAYMPEITNETERQILMEREVRSLFEEMPWLKTEKPAVRRAFMVPIVSKWLMPSNMYASKKKTKKPE